VIVVPQNPEQLFDMLEFLHTFSGVAPTGDTHVIGWVEGKDLRIVVGFNGWIGATCMMHVAMQPGWHFTPREMLSKCFRHAFTACERKLVLGIVNSQNERAIRYDEHLGFKELYRIPEMHDDGGDIVVLGMHKKECRYLNDPIPVEAVGHA
jgi:hypothetical protein